MAETTPSQPKWYTMTPEAVGKELGVDPAKGLSSSEAQQRLQKYGPNMLAGKAKEPGWRAFLRQYQDFMQFLLFGAAIVNQIATREWGTTLVLVVLTVFNAVLGLNQESKAEASLAALEKMMKNIARVRRDGQAIEVDAEQLVPGDIVLMEAGNRVPADGRLFVTATVEIEEAALTGESVASPKDTETIAKADAPLGDRHCMAYMNTAVTRGRGEMIVTTTGMGTEMGQHRRPVEQDRGRKNASAETAGQVDHHHCRPGRNRFRPDVHLIMEPGDDVRCNLHWQASLWQSQPSPPVCPLW